MGKVHFRDDTGLDDAPEYIKDEYRKKSEWSALCGYVRKNTTTNKGKVTCYYCRRLLIKN